MGSVLGEKSFRLMTVWWRSFVNFEIHSSKRRRCLVARREFLGSWSFTGMAALVGGVVERARFVPRGVLQLLL